jgi:hypothetical protein
VIHNKHGRTSKALKFISAQGDAEEKYAGMDSEEELEKDATLQGQSSAEDNDEDLEWHHKHPSDKADFHQFVGEQIGLNKTAAPNISENSKPLDFFLLYFQTIQPVTVQQTNCYMQQDAKARNKPGIPDSQQISMKYLYAFLAIMVQMGHNHQPSMKLHWTKDELYHIPFYSNVMPCDLFLNILKYLHFMDNQNP